MKKIKYYINKLIKRHKIIKFLVRIGLLKKVIKFKFNIDSNIYIDLEDSEPRNVFIRGVFDQDFFYIANSFINDNGVFFDLGANVGFCTFGLVNNKPNADYHMFEANIKLFDLLNRSKDLYPNKSISLNHCCLSQFPGESIFHVQKEQTGQSYVSTKKDGIKVTNCVLDEYCKKKQVKRIDFAKIDIEGYELQALKGWKKELSRNTIDGIYIEIIPDNQSRYGHRTNSPLFYLESMGYDLYLVKSSDFGYFGDLPSVMKCKNGSLIVSKFRAIDYPDTYSTDILAISNKYLSNL